MARTRKKLSEEEKKARRREQKKLIMRRLREKIKLNPQALEEKRRKDREYYYKKKAQGLVKTVHDLNPREQRKMRKKWRDDAKLRREKIKLIRRTERIMEEATPPSSPVPSMDSPSLIEYHRSSPKVALPSPIPSVNSPSMVSSPRPSTSRVNSGKAIAARNRKHLKAENLILRAKLKEAEQKLSKYRMREVREKQAGRIELTPNKINKKKHRTRQIDTEKKYTHFWKMIRTVD
ncbi:hypothetical protein O0L34_g7198 [Tuta absoluta]|nr:hypothetical protein O0L34_g7198 [Tuta absoluta]